MALVITALVKVCGIEIKAIRLHTESRVRDPAFADEDAIVRAVTVWEGPLNSVTFSMDES